MKINTVILFISSVMCTATAFSQQYTFEAGHPSLKAFLLPNVPPQPKDNQLTEARIELGKQLFFDPRLSAKGNMSCATCHNPSLGWSDGKSTAIGHDGKILDRASPTIINTAFNSIQMWDGRKKSLEDQAIGPMEASVEMSTDIPKMLDFLRNNKGYQTLFDNAYKGQGINKSSLTRAIASFERTVVSNNSPFDRWVKGDKNAMSKKQIEGFRLFADADKGNCLACHSGANFTDNGFHNLGLASFAKANPDLGRYKKIPLGLMKGAFKTPTIRDISFSAPYFHDGSAKTLAEVVDHYIKGGEVKTNLSPNMKPLTLDKQERSALIEFLQALNSPQQVVSFPVLPL